MEYRRFSGRFSLGGISSRFHSFIALHGEVEVWGRLLFIFLEIEVIAIHF